MTTQPTDIQRVEDYADIPLELLDIWVDANVRASEITAGVEELADNIKRIGLQQPIIVQERSGRYLILVGQRRYLAAKRLGLKTLTARIVSGLSPLQAKIWSLSENMLRQRLTPRDQAEATKSLYDELGSVSDVADQIGVSQGTVRNWLAYHNIVPEPIKEMVDHKRISARQARRLAEHVPDVRKAVSVAERMAQAGRTPSDRSRILATAEQNPDLPVDVIEERAERLKNVKRIIFVLPDEWDSALDVAATELDTDRNEVARDATIEWLRVARYKG